MKYILITGSSQGIGKGIALHFGKLGYHVFVTYHAHQDLGEETVRDISAAGGAATLLQVDVRDEDSVTHMYTEVSKITDTLDVLVNNAGAEMGGRLDEISLKDWQETLYVRLDGDFLCTRYALPFLKKSENANIFCIMSSLYENIDPEDPAACVSDGGTVSFIKALAVYLAQYKIRTNGIGPSEVATNLPYWQKNGSPELFADIAKNNPLGRLCTPQDIANTMQMIVDDPGKFLNGNIIYVNGGSHLK